eukprot:TRINITY_DN3380_c0_g1_i1.p1 TRINITY_DN3380_c0_g1~~TRINITY_DN3380_c0_g1_i1.p1  ORF type:complete len:355 (+),score=57.77 TRINITY_DN3380_c0_g1_i1:88-1152(+)
MQHIKCVVVGDGTVGKTCLLIAYTMKAFPTDYVPTVFDNYNAVVMWDGRPVNLGLWDTAGQDDFEAMRPMSYMNADIFLIFFAIDNPVSFQNVKHKWVPEINKSARETPRILVGTKMDCRDDPARLEQLQEKKIKPITRKQGRKLAKELGCSSYIECSAITKKGFRDVFGQTITTMMNARIAKRPGSDCWSTTCDNKLKVLSKKGKCVRCQHQFCGDCVVLLPRGHEFGGKMICKKCRDIESDEPLSRTEFREKMRKQTNGEKETEGERDGNEGEARGGTDESELAEKGGEAVPLSSSAIASELQRVAASEQPLSPEQIAAAEEAEREAAAGGGRKKRLTDSNKSRLRGGGKKD